MTEESTAIEVVSSAPLVKPKRSRAKKGKDKRTREVKYAAFAEHYLQTFNPVKAAAATGYANPHKEGYRLMADPLVQTIIRERVERYGMTNYEVVVRLASQARGTIADFVEIVDVPMTDKQGKPILDQNGNFVMTKMPRINLDTPQARNSLHLVKKISVSTNGGFAIEMYDAQKAMELIGKSLGMFTNDDLMKHVDLSKLTAHQLDRLAAGENIVAVLSKPDKE